MVLKVDQQERTQAARRHPAPEAERLLPPAIVAPICQFAYAVGIKGYSVAAEIEVQVNGLLVACRPAGETGVQGITIQLPVKLFAGDRVRVRQRCPGSQSDWSAEVTVRKA